MSDQDDENISPEMFDASDVTFEMRNRGRRQVVLIAKTETDFNLVKYYLALKGFVESMAREMNLQEESPGPH